MGAYKLNYLGGLWHVLHDSTALMVASSGRREYDIILERRLPLEATAALGKPVHTVSTASTVSAVSNVYSVYGFYSV